MLRIKIFSCKNQKQVRTEIQTYKVHSGELLKLLKFFVSSSKYVSANIPRDLNVNKYCCENLRNLNPLLQYVTQICHLIEYSITVTFTVDKI